MPDITWEEPYCAEGSACYRIGVDGGVDGDGNSYIAVAGAEAAYLTNTTDALRQLVRDVKAGKADHLLTD
ncbi:hypothetical protein OG594_28145 [Streptomyces sp. NBC_01214]|uniref:hypothetical protein n=1 Tax=Streptomyces sp. NBC_01214 TaxID=2903777 RepID=UPI002255A7FB|nr:hypothetical protein [Streptomyces sp. NBC_01214]MCX4805439.1 hypothetical protein [Streptomyces sp. NBC_01214]